MMLVVQGYLMKYDQAEFVRFIYSIKSKAYQQCIVHSNCLMAASWLF